MNGMLTLELWPDGEKQGSSLNRYAAKVQIAATEWEAAERKGDCYRLVAGKAGLVLTRLLDEIEEAQR